LEPVKKKACKNPENLLKLLTIWATNPKVEALPVEKQQNKNMRIKLFYRSKRECGYVFILACSCILLSAGCSTVSVVKVDSGGRRVKDAEEGIPFYLPRPYIDVFEPFVVDTRVSWAEGELTPDGKYVRLTSIPELAQSGMAGFTGQMKTVNSTVYLSSSSVGLAPGSPASPPPPAGQNQAALESSASGASSSLPSIIEALSGFAGALGQTSGATNKPSPTNSAPGTNSPSGNSKTNSTAKSGTGSLQATNNPVAWMTQPTRRFFDILWLQDFDEKYIVHPNYRFGNVSAGVSLGQGWSLQGLNTTADNSAVVQPLLDFYGSSLTALSAALSTAAGAPPVGNLAKTLSGSLSGGMQAAVEPNLKGAAEKGQVQTGVPISLKVSMSWLVAPGLYPILKPKEREMYRLTADTSQFDAENNYYSPKPPGTIAVFKTYPVLVVEAVVPTGDSPLNFTRYKQTDITNSTPPAKDTAGAGAEEQKPPSAPPSAAQLADLKTKTTNALAALPAFQDPSTHTSLIQTFGISNTAQPNEVAVTGTVKMSKAQFSATWPDGISNVVATAAAKVIAGSTLTNLVVGKVDVEPTEP
jgi:hypothetical protein